MHLNLLYDKIKNTCYVNNEFYFYGFLTKSFYFDGCNKFCLDLADREMRKDQ